MNMTKRKALELVIEMWDWLAANPGQDKENFLAAHPHYPQDLESDCACCEYDTEQNIAAPGPRCDTTVGDCRFCPLQSLWGRNCTSGRSPYTAWAMGGFTNEASTAAKTIADAARAELAKLEGRDE